LRSRTTARGRVTSTASSALRPPTSCAPRPSAPRLQRNYTRRNAPLRQPSTRAAGAWRAPRRSRCLHLGGAMPTPGLPPGRGRVSRRWRALLLQPREYRVLGSSLAQPSCLPTHSPPASTQELYANTRGAARRAAVAAEVVAEREAECTFSPDLSKGGARTAPHAAITPEVGGVRGWEGSRGSSVRVVASSQRRVPSLAAHPCGTA
jgi:hypothetical protein